MNTDISEKWNASVLNMSIFITELLHQYCKLLLKPPSDLTTTLITHVIHAALMVATKQCDIKPGKLFSFFKKYFVNNVRYVH